MIYGTIIVDVRKVASYLPSGNLMTVFLLAREGSKFRLLFPKCIKVIVMISAFLKAEMGKAEKKNVLMNLVQSSLKRAEFLKKPIRKQ